MPVNSAPHKDGLPLPQRFFAILTLCFGTSLVVIDGSIATVALPTIAKALSVKESHAVLVVTLYQLVLVMGLLPLSSMAERIGYRKIYKSGLALFVVGTFLCLFVNSLNLLIFLRIIQALGAAAVMSVSAALIRPIYPKALLGRGMAINSMTVAASAAIAPTLGGYILSLTDWPMVFAASAPFGIIGLLLSRFLPPPIQRDIPYDSRSAIHSALTFGFLIAALEITIHGTSTLLATMAISFAIINTIMFIRSQARATHPILPIRIIRKPLFSLSFTSAFLAFTANMMVFVLMPFVLERHYNFSVGEIGTILAAWPLMSVLSAPIANILSDKLNPILIGSFGAFVATIGLFTILTLPQEPDKLDIAWRLACCGGGFSCFLASNARLIISNVPETKVAVIGGLIATVRLCGQTFGASLAAALLASRYSASVEAILLPACIGIIMFFTSASRLWIMTKK